MLPLDQQHEDSQHDKYVASEISPCGLRTPGKVCEARPLAILVLRVPSVALCPCGYEQTLPRQRRTGALVRSAG